MKNTFRTSNNVFRNEVKAYIIQALSTDETSYLPNQLQDTVNAFNDYDSPYNQRKIPNKQARFIDWLQGLPSEIYITPYNHEQELLMEEWFTNCEQPYKSQKDPSQHFYYFIADNFQRLCKTHDISF